MPPSLNITPLNLTITLLNLNITLLNLITTLLNLNITLLNRSITLRNLSITLQNQNTMLRNLSITPPSPTTRPRSQRTTHPSPTTRPRSQQYHAPKPDYKAPEPAYHAPKPDYKAPEPAYHAPKPDYKAPEPAYHAPKPDYKAPEPVYHAPKPDYKAPEPAYHAPKSGYAAPVYAPSRSYLGPVAHKAKHAPALPKHVTYEGPDDHKYVPPTYEATKKPASGYEIEYMPYKSPAPMPYADGALPLKGSWGFAHGLKSQLGYVSDAASTASYGHAGVHGRSPTVRPAYAPGHYLPGLLATPHFNGRPSSAHIRAAYGYPPPPPGGYGPWWTRLGRLIGTDLVVRNYRAPPIAKQAAPGHR
ncbi:extensin-like [Pollicipes pollicipes]|uniref:extensin-like n=1 Tax=Pollicipes pollicipes TaxID=41117 RepID=UPI00188536AA|nr:extensin-like [Pollicipes pollicipes]